MTQIPAAHRPLSPDEVIHLRRWERGVIRAWAMAATVVAVAVALAVVFGDSAESRVVVLGGGLLLLAVIIILQLREGCPRCGARLALQSLPVLPDSCRRCGTAFPRPPPLDSEIDN